MLYYLLNLFMEQVGLFNRTLLSIKNILKTNYTVDQVKIVRGYLVDDRFFVLR